MGIFDYVIITVLVLIGIFVLGGLLLARTKAPTGKLAGRKFDEREEKVLKEEKPKKKKSLVGYLKAFLITLIVMVAIVLAITLGSAILREIDTKHTSTCRLVSAIPQGASGDFCINGTIGESFFVTPPPYTFTQVVPTASIELRYFNWDGDLLDTQSITKGEHDWCMPAGFSRIKITFLKAGTIRVRIGLPPIPELPNCS